MQKSKPVEKIVREKENEIRRQSYESAFLFDPQGNLLFGKDGAQYEVGFSLNSYVSLLVCRNRSFGAMLIGEQKTIH